MQNKILINVLGIQDSGGITVLNQLLDDLSKDDTYIFLIVCHKNKNIDKLINKYSYFNNFEFIILESNGLFYRLCYENLFFRKLIKEKNVDLVYNFSGSAQFFLKVPQLTKVHNLLFYSKKIDQVYYEKKEYLKWLKQVLFKRVVFHAMLRQTTYIEIQSKHVQSYMTDFINITNKIFFIKSDVDVLSKKFEEAKNYDFSKKIRFLFIVGNHFDYLHKNFQDFVDFMSKLCNEDFNFEIVVTLTKDQLHKSRFWNKLLDSKTNFLGYITKEEIQKQFQENTILISTSVIETLGLHVIEATQNGVLAIVPNEYYCKSVYGHYISTYTLFDIDSLLNRIKKISLLNINEIKDIIYKNQRFLIENEILKDQFVIGIFDQILKDKNVQR